MASSQGKNELKFADWMATLPESIHSIPLTNLAIPGRRAEAADGALGVRSTCPALLYLPRSGNLPRCPREGNSSPGVGLGQKSACLGASGLLAFSKRLGTAARGVKVTDFPWVFEAGCVRRLGQGKGLAPGRPLVAPCHVFPEDSGLGAISGAVG